MKPLGLVRISKVMKFTVSKTKAEPKGHEPQNTHRLEPLSLEQQGMFMKQMSLERIGNSLPMCFLS